MNRTKQTASCPQSGSSRAGPPGRTHQRTTQSSTCKGGGPSPVAEPQTLVPFCPCGGRGPGQGSLANPDALGSLRERARRAWSAALPPREGHPRARDRGTCSDHCGGSRAPRSRPLPLRALLGPTSGDPPTLHCQGEASAPHGPGRPVLTPKLSRSKS